MQELKNLEYERCIISALINDLKIFDEIELYENDFTADVNKRLFRELKLIHDSGLNYDYILLKEKGFLYEVVRKYDLPTSANWKYYYDNIKELSRKRRIMQLSYLLPEKIQTMDTAEISEYISSYMFDLENNEKGNYNKISDVLYDYVLSLEELYKNKGKPDGITTGYDAIDKYIKELEAEQYIIIGARPSVGKSRLMLSFIINILKKYKVGMFSCEMNLRSILDSLTAGKSKIDLMKIKTGMFGQSDMTRMVDGISWFYDKTLLIDDTPNISFPTLRKTARRMVREGAEIIFVDYIGLIEDKTKALPRHEEISQISRAAKGLARELKIPMVWLSQVGRQTDGRMPRLSDLRDSGSIEQDADIIIFLHPVENSKVEFNVAKQRNGPTGGGYLYFNKPCAIFENWKGE